MAIEPKRDHRFKALDTAAFIRAAKRLNEVGQPERILTEAEITVVRDRVMPKVSEALDEYLNRRGENGPTPTEYGAMRSKAWQYSAVLVLTWRDSAGMRPAAVDRASKELGEIIGGLTPILAELRDAEADLAEAERSFAAREQARESEARETQRLAAIAELAEQFKARGIRLVPAPAEG